MTKIDYRCGLELSYCVGIGQESIFYIIVIALYKNIAHDPDSNEYLSGIYSPSFDSWQKIDTEKRQKNLAFFCIASPAGIEPASNP